MECSIIIVLKFLSANSNMCQLCIGFDERIYFLLTGHIFLFLCMPGNCGLKTRYYALSFGGVLDILVFL